MKIMLDAGHGYNTAGKRSPNGMREYEFNRVAAIYARELLEEHQGVSVYFAHSDEKDVPLKERTDKANRLNVDCYVSIHANAYGSGWNKARGIETYVYTSKPKKAYELAQKIQKNLIVSTGLPNRGVKTANFHVLRETKMTAVLIECGFMTNQEDAKLLRSDAYRKACAEAIVKAIREEYGLKQLKSVLEKKGGATSENSLYKVQVGAFQNKKNANELAAKLRKEGYDPFIYKV